MSKLRRNYQSLVHNVRHLWSRITSQNNDRDAEQQLERRHELLVLQSVTAGLEHDFQTPLLSMKTEIAILRRRYPHDERVLRSLARLDNDLQRMSSVLSLKCADKTGRHSQGSRQQFWSI